MLTPYDLLKRFPRASKAVLERNCDPPAGIPAGKPECAKRSPLVSRVSRKETGSSRFEISFTIHAIRPCDWDGWHIKPIQDLLVAIGAIPGDEWHILSGSVCSRQVHTPEEEGTEVVIYEKG